jgi:hypothetical protein
LPWSNKKYSTDFQPEKVINYVGIPRLLGLSEEGIRWAGCLMISHRTALKSLQPSGIGETFLAGVAGENIFKASQSLKLTIK